MYIEALKLQSFVFLTPTIQDIENTVSVWSYLMNREKIVYVMRTTLYGAGVGIQNRFPKIKLWNYSYITVSIDEQRTRAIYQRFLTIRWTLIVILNLFDGLVNGLEIRPI